MRKYRNQTCNGYHSKKEAKRALELMVLERAGKIQNLREQVRIELLPAQYSEGRCIERAVHYVADFAYTENGIEILEDVKGFRTDTYKLKKKLLLFRHGIRIRET